MKKITLWLFALFTCWQITAQTGTVVVGSNDGTPNSSTGAPSPLQDYFKTQRIQMLYTAAELTGAGLVAGNITEIGWVATALNLSTLQENYTISLKSTTATVLTTTFETGATVVYGPTDFTPSATGNVMFTLTTPFAWDGTSNIIVEVCAGLASGAWSENVSCANSTTATNKTVYSISDSSTAPCTQTTGTITDQRPLLVATGSVASCLAPLNVVSANVTAFTADISWDAATPTPGIGYQYVVSTSNTVPTAAGTATTNIYASLTSLLPQTTYYIFVRSNCSTGQFSGWNGPSSFTTSCAPITTFPSVEPFDTFLPNACWLKGDNGDLTAGPATFGSNGFYQDGFANNGFTGSFAYNIYLAAANDWIISPQFTIPATGYELKFDAAAANYGATTAVTDWESDDSVEVLVSSTGTTNWTVLSTFNASNVPSNTGSVNIIDLDAYSGQTVRFAYRVVEGTTNGAADLEFSVDNFQIRLTPSCIEPLGLVSASITSTGASISWDATSPVPSVGYEYFVSTTNTLPTTAGTATTNTFAVLTGLAPATTYYIFIRANCGSGALSPWSTSISFTTACASVTSFIQNFDAVTLPGFPVCWGKLGTGGSAYIDSFNANSTPNVLYMSSWSTTDLAVVKMQPVSNLGTGTHRLKLKIRGSWSTGGIIEFGYLTNPMDATTFVALTTMTAASLTYENMTFAPPVGTYSDYPAFRHTGAPSNSLLIDDVIWEAIPSCVEPTALVYANITSSGVDVSWTAPTTAPANGYQYVVSTSATLPSAAGTAVTNTFVSVSGLTPSTTYYIFVRAICSTTDASPWVGPVSFLTACVPVTTLPWTEGFEGLTTVGNSNFPPCWSKENGDWVSRNSNDTYSTSNNGTNFIRNSWSATNEIMWTPGFQLTAGTSYDFSSYIQGDNGDSWAVDYLVNSNQIATGATQLGTTYAIPGAGSSYAAQPYSKITRSFTPTTTGVYYFAIRLNEPTGGPWYASFDDFELKVTPNVIPTCATQLTATPNTTCGNFASQLSWAPVTDATGYYVTIGTTSGGTDIANAVSVSTTNYSFSGTINTQYFWKVVPFSGAGPATGCAIQSFTTVATGCYCASVPTSNDGTGITNATVGTTPFVIADVMYANNTTTAVAVEPGTNTNVQLTFATGFTYDINVWIDFNNDFDFNDAGELVKTGIACTDVEPNTVDASFLMPVTAPTGAHRMRIGTADAGQAPPAPCYSGSYGVTLDFTVDTTLGSNSFDTSNFVAYPNPVKDVLNLSYKSAISNVKVINLLGQEVVNAKANTNDVQVNMSALNAGVYIVNVTVDDTVHSIKVIKE
ncbi:T9SS type A sorting domain-containing protein [Flavobacterium sp.]|uniref:fibronectin type III domain-containing protein n=1 Tax=Flavobacterium sp. TaxID=239 RepID=UPI001B3DE62B|nr:T9SS type A sorting domain-containing protein [Flavobacterium sp.]MBP6127284.1 T9SS type A sorting domain-containing protein [Flavobacterium sp.]